MARPTMKRVVAAIDKVIADAAGIVKLAPKRRQLRVLRRKAVKLCESSNNGEGLYIGGNGNDNRGRGHRRAGRKK